MIQVDSVKVGALAVNCCIVTDTATKKTAVVDPVNLRQSLKILLKLSVMKILNIFCLLMVILII